MSNTIEAIATAVEQFTTKSAAEISALKSQTVDLANELKDLSQKQNGYAGAGGVVSSGPGGRDKLLNHMLANDEGLKAMREGRSRAAILNVPGGVGMLLKSTIVGDVESSVTDLFPVQPQRAGGIYNDQRQLLPLIAAMPRMQVQSGSFEYVSIDSAYTDDADYQLSQGAAKAETALPTELLTANIATVATTLVASEQILADQAGLSAFIASKLSYQVLLKLEQEIINGAGGTGRIDGLINLGTTFVASSNTDTADAVGECIAELQTLGWMPSAVLMHPRTWQQVRSVRIDDGAGEYLAGGWSTPAAPSIWNVPVIACPAMPTNKVVVLDMNQVMLLDRQNVNFQFGYVDQQFVQNLRTARAELRAGLMVAAPSAVQVLTI